MHRNAIIQLPWRLFRTTVSSADTDLIVTARTWAAFQTTHRPKESSAAASGAIAVRLSENEGEVLVCFDFNDNAGTAEVVIYAYSEKGPAEFVCGINTITAGTQQGDLDETTTARFFAHNFGAITQRWIGGADSVTEIDSNADNGVAKLRFKTYGYKYLLVLFPTLSGSDNVRAYIKGFSD